MNRSFLLTILLSLSSCVPLQSSVTGRDNLANLGPVMVSKSNPYLASNLLLAKETELNSTLRGFIKIKGKPEALEIRKEFLRPYYMYFYYPSLKERYVLEEIDGDWVIRGPEVLVNEVLSNMPVDIKPAAKVGADIENTASVLAPVDLLPPAAETLPASKKEVLAAADEIDGDIIHLVKYQGETLRLIASWYTGNADNAMRIARINGFKDANALILDQKIRIPRYMVTKDIPLTKAEVDFYLKR